MALSQNLCEPASAKHAPVNTALTLHEPAELKVSLTPEGFSKSGVGKKLNCSLLFKDSPASTFCRFSIKMSRKTELQS